jgi:hypothetical protein
MCSITVIVVGEQAPVVNREWQPAGRADESMGPRVSLMVGWHDTLEPNRPTGQAEKVDVNGVAAQLIRTEGLTYVIWQPSGEPQLIVTVEDDNDDRRRTTALHMARSVGPDPRFTWVGPRFDWLPAELADVPWQVRVGYHDVAWQQSIAIGNPRGHQLVVEIGPNAHNGRLDKDHDHGQVIQAVRVRGLDGWQEPAEGLLFLTLPDGVEVLLQFSPPPLGPSTVNPGQSSQASDSAAQLVHIAEKCDFGPWPDMSWIGTTT